MIQLTISNGFAHLKDVENLSEAMPLNLGSQLISDRFFSKFPPSYDEIDQAINYTEEELEKIKHLFDGVSTIYTTDSMSVQIAQLAFNTTIEENLISVARIELENVFSRLADIVKGLPPSQDVLPDNNEFAAYLVVLREVMHHLNFDKLLVQVE